MSWYSGEMKNARIIITVIGLWFVCCCLINFCRSPVIRIINFFKYKQAAIIPLQIAQITDEPINTTVISIKTDTVKIIT